MEIDSDAFGALGSVAAAVVAVVAASVAIWQARVASTARDAAQDQARSAQEAVEEARASRHHAERPRFHIEITAPPNAKGPWTTITMSEGPEVQVVISWERQLSVVDFDEDGMPFEDRCDGSGRYETGMAVNGTTMLPWWKDGIPDDIIWLSAKITIEANELSGERRTWRHVESISWRPD